MDIKKQYKGQEVYAPKVGRMVLISDENIELFNDLKFLFNDNPKKKPSKRNSDNSKRVDDNSRT